MCNPGLFQKKSPQVELDRIVLLITDLARRLVNVTGGWFSCRYRYLDKHNRYRVNFLVRHKRNMARLTAGPPQPKVKIHLQASKVKKAKKGKTCPNFIL